MSLRLVGEIFSMIGYEYGQFFHLESFNSQTLPSESISKQANPEMNHDFSETTAEDLQPPFVGSPHNSDNSKSFIKT